MRRIERPEEVASAVFLNCISVVRNVQLKNRLTACSALIDEACTEFRDKVTTGELHTITRETIVNGNVTAKELEDVYTLRMAKKNRPGRDLYDRIKMSAPHGVCPLCSLREATTLDHYLPKALYPRLAVVPINLIPACRDCNTLKLSVYPENSHEETIHPYFDDIENDRWLHASVVQSTPPVIKFAVTPPLGWTELLAERLSFHFDSLEIHKLYSTHAASELRQINYRLNALYDQFGAGRVREYLLEGEETRSHDNINSWQAAMYHATANNNWFCNGGFRLTEPD